MHTIARILPWIQIVFSIILIASILLQQSGSGVGGAFGGGEGSIKYTRRGAEKFLFYLSMVVSILFAASALLAVIIKTKI